RSVVSFFFFQAEDGIRDDLVTGVQTCALPISDMRERGEPVAILYASEGAIYGRYGFGLGTYAARVRVGRGRGAFRAPASVDGLQIGRASCRERGERAVGAGAVDKRRGRSTGTE